MPSAPMDPPTQQIATLDKTTSIPNLLSPSKAPVISQMTFSLSMRQQPRAARACSVSDRRNIDPSPIVQLHVHAPGITDEDVMTYLRYEGYIVNCSIYDEAGVKDMSVMPSERRNQQRLVGSLVCTPFYGRDELGNEGCFFAFSDLSVRTLGRYRIKFSLIVLDVRRPGTGMHFPILADIFSCIFEVYNAREYTGVNERTELETCLKEQGCAIFKKDKGKSLQ